MGAGQRSSDYARGRLLQKIPPRRAPSAAQRRQGGDEPRRAEAASGVELRDPGDRRAQRLLEWDRDPLLRAAHVGPSGYHGVGPGALRLRQRPRGGDRKASVRSVLRRASIDRSRPQNPDRHAPRRPNGPRAWNGPNAARWRTPTGRREAKRESFPTPGRARASRHAPVARSRSFDRPRRTVMRSNATMSFGAIREGVGRPGWWRVPAAPSVGRPNSEAPFWALIAFTVVLIIAPQGLFPALAPFRPAFLTAAIAT